MFVFTNSSALVKWLFKKDLVDVIFLILKIKSKLKNGFISTIPFIALFIILLDKNELEISILSSFLNSKVILLTEQSFKSLSNHTYEFH